MHIKSFHGTEHLQVTILTIQLGRRNSYVAGLHFPIKAHACAVRYLVPRRGIWRRRSDIGATWKRRQGDIGATSQRHRGDIGATSQRHRPDVAATRRECPSRPP